MKDTLCHLSFNGCWLYCQFYQWSLKDTLCHLLFNGCWLYCQFYQWSLLNLIRSHFSFKITFSSYFNKLWMKICLIILVFISEIYMYACRTHRSRYPRHGFFRLTAHGGGGGRVENMVSKLTIYGKTGVPRWFSIQMYLAIDFYHKATTNWFVGLWIFFPKKWDGRPIKL